MGGESSSECLGRHVMSVSFSAQRERERERGRIGRAHV